MINMKVGIKEGNMDELRKIEHDLKRDELRIDYK